MAIQSGSLIELTLQGTYINQRWANVYTYQIQNLPVTVTLPNIAEAWWQAVRVQYRAMFIGTVLQAFQSVRFSELNDPNGVYGEYAIPAADRSGTRSATGLGEQMPPFIAAGWRMTVATRATRPGQKRVPGMMEADAVITTLEPGYQNLVQTLANTVSGALTLGAPAALTSMFPVICRRDANGFVAASQAVTGNIVNPLITTQNSRKVGRGI